MVGSTELQIHGLDELRQALRRLPPELVRDAGPIVHAAAEETGRSIRATYEAHRKTGNLAEHVAIDIAGDAVSATARVRSTAKHAWLFERGSGPRRWAKNGKATGVMPATPTLVPIAVRRRSIMVAALVDLVEKAGLTVTGSA